MTNDPDVTLEGGYLPVNAELIESRLNDIWRDAAADPTERRLVKLCLANMLVVADASSRTEAEQLAQQLAIRHPSRVLLIVVDETLAIYGAFVRTACEFNPEMDAYLCWEIVEVVSDLVHAEQIAGAVRSLLIDSVPVVTIDFRKYQNTPGFDADLHGLSDYYFVQADVVPASARFRGLVPLSWYRTLPIRELMGDMFAGAVCAGQSARVTAITIFHTDSRERLDPLLAGWLLNRMADDKVFASDGAAVRFKHRTHPIRLSWQKTTADDDRIMEFTYDSGGPLVATAMVDKAGQFESCEAGCGPMKMTRNAREIDLVTYVLAAIGDDAEFREYAEVQRISVQLPIP
jgi:glucose-6-phosphate dehydrogenase assembly protein OpcA